MLNSVTILYAVTRYLNDKRNVKQNDRLNGKRNDRTIRRETIDGGVSERDLPVMCRAFSSVNRGRRTSCFPRNFPESLRNPAIPGAVVSGRLLMVRILTRGLGPNRVPSSQILVVASPL